MNSPKNKWLADLHDTPVTRHTEGVVSQALQKFEQPVARTRKAAKRPNLGRDQLDPNDDIICPTCGTGQVSADREPRSYYCYTCAEHFVVARARPV